MPAAAEWTDPVAYDGQWAVLAIVAVLAVVLFYAVVLLLGRPDRVRPAAPTDVAGLRAAHLARVDTIEAQVRDGALPLRTAYQQLSEVVRGYAGAVTPLPATTMTLADLRAAGAHELAGTVALLYPPEFAPDQHGLAEQRFDRAVHEARTLVSTWG